MDETNPLDALDEAPGANPAASETPPAAAAAPPDSQLQSTPVDSGNPLDELDDEHPAVETHKALNEALGQTTGDQLPEVTIQADRQKPASWGDVGGAILPTIGANIETKLAGVEEWKGSTDYNSARKKLWQSMVLPEAVRRAQDENIPLTEDNEVVSLSQHLGIRPDQFTRDWPTYVNQGDKERQEFQAKQRLRIQDSEPAMTEGGERRRMAAQVSQGVAPNTEASPIKGLAFETATMAPDLLVGVGGTMATGGVGGVALMAADIAPGEYAQARNMGLDDRKASTYAMLSTIASSVPEVPVLRVVSGSAAGRKILQTAVGEKLASHVAGKVAGTSITQGVTQSFVQALQQGIDSGLLDEKDSLSDALGKIAHAGLVGTVTGAPLGLVHHALTREPKPTTLKDQTPAGQGEQTPAGQGPQRPRREEGESTADYLERVRQAHNASLPPLAPAPDIELTGEGASQFAPVPRGTEPSTENAEPPTSSDTHAALLALEAKDPTPPQLEMLEKAGLATRNDVGIPRFLPAGRRELNRLNQTKPEAAAVAPSAQGEPEQPPPHTDEEVPPIRPEGTGQNEAHAEWAGLSNEKAAAAPLSKEEEKASTTPFTSSVPTKTPELPQKTPVGTELGVNRFTDDQDLRAALSAMKNETGWAETGGRVIRNEETGVVTGRTKWVPNAEWWPGRPKGLTETQVHAAVDKALAGQKLSKRESSMVEYMRDVHDARQATEAYLPQNTDTPADYEHKDQLHVPTDDAYEAGMVARLADLDPDTFESLAKEHEDSEPADFLKAVKAALDEHDRQTTGSYRPEGAGSVAEETKKTVGGDLFGQDLSRQQALHNETLRRDAERSGSGKDISPDTGRPGDLFSTNANRQTDLVDAVKARREEGVINKVVEGDGRERAEGAEGFRLKDIVRLNVPNAPKDRQTGQPIHHGERARIRSIFRFRAGDPWIFGVSHEFGGMQALSAHELQLLSRKPQQEGLFADQLKEAREATNTTPTDAMKEAGNYAKGRVSFGGMEVAIENPAGSVRKGISSKGENWERTMKADYGYIKGTQGKDGDAVDVFLTGKPDTGRVFVINQMNPQTGGFDEHKAILGADDRREATKTYRDHYPSDWKGMGTMVEMSTPDFKEWVNSPRARRQIRPERRSDTERRRRVAEMSAEQLRKELLTHELTEIPNRRAYDEAEKLPVQVSVDVDSLKWINDNMGHDSGNELLKAIASSLSQHTEQAFHLSGDEFAVQAHTEAEAQEVMRQVADHLQHATIEVELPDGKIRQIKGLGVSFGTGKTLKEADEALQGHKTRREREGLRAARGEAPPGASIRPGESGREDQAHHPSEEEGLTRTQVKEDGAAFSEPKALSTAEGGTADKTGKGPTLDLFAPTNRPNAALARRVAGPTQAARAGQSVQTRLVRTGTFTSGIKRVKTWQDAAHILAPLRKSPQESLMALVLDAARKPIAVLRHSLGTFNEAPAHVGHLAGSILRIPGAKTFYLAHNHPSGNPEASLTDAATTQRINDLTRGSGVELDGHVIFQPGSKEATFLPDEPPIGAPGARGEITAASRHRGTPVEQLERQFSHTVPLEKQAPAITEQPMALQAAKMARHQTKSDSGILLLNNQSRLVRVLPMDAQQMARLRTRDPSTGIGAILRAVEGSNGSQAIVFSHVKDQRAADNAAKALNAANVGVIDRVMHDDGRGWTNRGSGRLLGNHFESRRTEPAKPTDTPQFKRWFGESAVTDEKGAPKRVFHGTSRLDRWAQGHKRSRATSGPMPYFTEDPEMASSYAKGKQDTSLADEEVSDYDQWFKYKPPGAKGEGTPVADRWNQMSQEEQDRFNANMRRLTHDEDDNLVLSEEPRGGLSASKFDDSLQSERGNGIKAARDLWVSSGTLWNEEGKFMDVLKKAGLDMKHVEYDNPHANRGGLVPAYLKIERPLDTKDLSQQVNGQWKPTQLGQKLLDAVSQLKFRGREYGSDQWDKRTYSAQKWRDALHSDLHSGDTFAWTTLPDKVTQLLESMGYDGIKDTGGKNGGPEHTVWVPFHPEQVKSAVGNIRFGANRDLMKRMRDSAPDTHVTNVANVVSRTIADHSLAGPGLPPIQVHRDVSTLPRHILDRIQADHAEHLTSAVYDPEAGHVHVIAANNGSEREVQENILHEVVGHHGLRMAMDPAEYNETMDGINRDMPERVEAAAQRNGLDLDDPRQRRAAAEEVVAYTAGQMLSGQEIPKPMVPWYERVLRSVRGFVTKLRGGKVYDDKALHALIARAKDSVRTGSVGLLPGEPMSAARAPRYYSALERFVSGSKQEKAGADQWLGMLKNAPGVKAEELDWLGVPEWLKAQTGPVTRQEFADHLARNAVSLEETTYGEKAPAETQQTQDEREQIRQAEALRAEGHLVTFDDDGHLDQFHYKRPGIQDGEPVYRAHSVNAEHYIHDQFHPEVPEELRQRVKALEELSGRVAQHRATPAGWGETGGGSDTRYDDYTLPGGENYQEMLLRLPDTSDRQEIESDYQSAESARQLRDRNAARDRRTGTYRSSHWREPNVVAHVRFKDRTDAQGRKVLHLEELQSDWHQAGRDRGYIDPNDPNRPRIAQIDQQLEQLKSGMTPQMLAEYFTPGRIIKGYSGYDKVIAFHPGDENGHNWKVTVTEVNADGTPNSYSGPRTHQTNPVNDYAKALKDERARLMGNKVPNAPFKQSWPMLLMKRMIRYAAENGHDRLSWTTGEQNAERYGLEQHFDQLRLQGGDGDRTTLIGFKDGRVVDRFDVKNDAHLSELIGPELSQRLLSSEPISKEGATTKVREISGVDLKTGGEGMREFYDKILPREAQKLVKKYGGKVESGLVHTDESLGGPWKFRADMPMTVDDIQRRRDAAARSGRSLLVDEMDKVLDAMKAGTPFEEAALAHASNASARFYGGEFYQDKVPNAESAHGFDITPELRNAALSEGFPLFARRQSALALQQPKPKGVFQRMKAAWDLAYESKFSRDIRKYAHPVGLSQESRQAARTAIAYLGRQAHDSVESQEALEKFSRVIEQLPVADQLEMIDHIERGLPQRNPELQPVADKMREMLDYWRDQVRNLGDGYLDNFIQDYFPHYWADADQEKAQRLVADIQGRAPLRGPATFLKQRTIPTIKEGMDKGLKPLSTNPLILTLLKTREMQRFVTGVKLMKQYKEDGLAVFLPATHPMPDGWAGINDNIAKVRQWSDAEQGFIDRGQYIMPIDAARVINNHVSRSWFRDFSPIDMVRVTGNMLNAMQLGFSAFHLGFTTLDAIISKNALAIERLLHGEPARAAASFLEALTGPGAALLNVRRGHNLLKAYTNVGGATPEMAKLVQALQEGGGRAHMDKYYQLAQGVSPFRGVGFRSLAGDLWDAMHAPTDKLENLARAAGNFPKEYATKLLREAQALGKTHTVLQMPFEIAGRMVRASTSWIMEHLVPMQKLGVFSDLAADHLRRNPNQDPHERAAAMQSIWASVDNRLGEMVYDNLFWNRTMKDALHLGIRAVGWNVGTVSEIAGAPADLVSAIAHAVEQRRYSADDLGHKIPYVLAMAATTAIYGAVMNYFFTGEGPKETKDVYFPRTGGTTNYGTPQRVSLPSYAKDVYEYSQQPGETVLNKLNPMFNVIGEMWRNEDFFGNPITDPGESGWEAAKHRAQFVASEFTPFSLQGRQQIAQSDQPGLGGQVRRLLPSVGITPAPGYVTSPEQIETLKKFEAEKKYVSDMSFKYKKALLNKDEAGAKEYLERLIAAKKHLGELTRDRMQDKGKAAVARRKNATALRQQGMPAMANLVAALPLQPDGEAIHFFERQAAGA